jgi:hypothetical protein
MSPQFADEIWLAIKYTAPVITALYGFFATVTDFRVEKDGKKVLSRKAYWGMALLVVSTALGMGSDAHKDREERVQALEIVQKEDILGAQLQSATTTSEKMSKTLGDTEKTLDKNVNTTASVLRETRRAIDPIEHSWWVIATIDVPENQPSVRTYINRILGAETKRETAGRGFSFTADQSGFPDANQQGEAALAELAGFSQVQLAFYRPRDVKKTPVLTLTANCDQQKPSGQGLDENGIRKELFDLYASSSESTLRIRCNSWSVSEEGTPALRSYSDFPGLGVMVEITGKDLGADSPDSGRLERFEINQIGLGSATSRILSIEDLKPTKCSGSEDSAYRILDDGPYVFCFESHIARNRGF